MAESEYLLTQTFAVGVLLLRLIIVLAAILFCYLGYRLFAQVSSVSNAELSVGEHFRANFVHVGPGVFFSLFGAAILIYALLNPQQLALAPAARPPSSGPGVVVSGATAEDAAMADAATLLRAGQQIAFLNRIDPGGSIAPQDVADIDRLSRMIRFSVMQSVWQPAWGDRAEFEQWLRDPGSMAPNAEARAFFERQ